MPTRPRHLLRAGVLAGVVALQLSGCVPAPKPTPAPAPAPAPAPPPPAPLPPPPPAPANWRDAPRTAGDWRYTPGPGGGTASFGMVGAAPLFSLRCDRASGTVVIARSGANLGLMTLRMENAGEVAFNLAVEASGAGPAVHVAANSPVLDAMAYSRGRFAVEVAGAPTLYLPSWPEVARVVEDCR